MAYREFEQTHLSRRALFRGGARLGLGAAFLSTPFGAALAHADAARASWPKVAALVDEFVDSGKVANMVAVLGWGQAEPTGIAKGQLAMGRGPFADLDSLYRIYSMTKPVTGMAAMILIDEGKLGLDQPIADFIPGFAEMQVQREYDGSIEDTVPAEQLITVRHLLTHTAGLGYTIVQNGPIQKAYAEAGINPGLVTKLPFLRDILNPNPPAPSLEAFANNLAELPLVLQPGEKWSYSVSLDLLGRVIELASGMPFDTFLHQRIFEPAGMTSTWFTVPQSEVERLTTNYGIQNGNATPIDPASASVYLDKPPFGFGGAGLVCSPRDFDRFLQMILGYGMIDGTRVMSEAAVKLGTSNLLPEGVITDGTWIEGQGFGAGGRVSDGAFGWGGAAGTVAFVSHEAGLRASIYTQYMPSDAYPIHSAFPAAVLGDLAALKAAA